MGEDGVGMKSKTVTIEADGVCSIKGKMALKLQEAEGPKGKKSKSSGSQKEDADKAKAPPPSPNARKRPGTLSADENTAKPSQQDMGKDKADPSREKGPLCVRIDMPPKHAKQVDARFILTSSDKSITITLTVRDDMDPGNDTVDLLFEDLWKDLSYSLRVEESGGVADVLFENVPYSDLASPVAAQQDGSMEDKPHG
jgi:hypothetical protein